jgi:PAS domain S-box-containing protein
MRQLIPLDRPEMKAADEGLFRLLFMSIHLPACVADGSGKILMLNEAAVGLTGSAQPSLVGADITAVYTAEAAGVLTAAIQEVLTSSRPAVVEARLRSADREQWFEYHIQPVKGKLAVLILSVDVTKSKQVETGLRDTNTQTVALLSSISSILIGVDGGGTVSHWNATAAEVFGIPAQVAVGSPFRDCSIIWDWEMVLAAAAKCAESGQQVRLDNVHYQTPGMHMHILGLAFSPLKNGNDRHSGFLLLGRDITQRMVREKEEAQAKHLQAIGKLAAGIAHEVNTPIQFVGLNNTFLKKRFGQLAKLLALCERIAEKDGDAAANLENMRELVELTRQAQLPYLLEQIPIAIDQSIDGVERIARITAAMRDFTYMGGEEMSVIDINRAIASTITVAQNEWKKAAEIETDFDPGLAPIHCYPSDLNGVFLNLLVNAADAVGDAGHEARGTVGKIRFTTRQHADWVEVRIWDNGTGIPESAREHMFEPFFTTKGMGKGTGQGLYITRQAIVDKHHGTIEFQTETGKWTEFIIRLPVDSRKGK